MPETRAAAIADALGQICLLLFMLLLVFG